MEQELDKSPRWSQAVLKAPMVCFRLYPNPNTHYPFTLRTAGSAPALLFTWVHAHSVVLLAFAASF